MKYSENIKIDDLLEILCKKIIQLNKKKEKNTIEKLFEKITKGFSKTKFNKEERRIIRNIIHEIDDYKSSETEIKIKESETTIIIKYKTQNLKTTIFIYKNHINYKSSRIGKNNKIKCNIIYNIGKTKSKFYQKNYSLIKKDIICYEKDIKTGIEKWDF